MSKATSVESATEIDQVFTQIAFVCMAFIAQTVSSEGVQCWHTTSEHNPVENFSKYQNQSSDILQHSQNRPTGDRWLKL